MKVNVILVLIIGFFLLMRGLLVIFNIVISFISEGYFFVGMEMIVYFMVFLGLLLDFFVYVLFNWKLWKEVFFILCKCVKKRLVEEEFKDIVDYLRMLIDNYVFMRNLFIEISWEIVKDWWRCNWKIFGLNEFNIFSKF